MGDRGAASGEQPVGETRAVSSLSLRRTHWTGRWLRLSALILLAAPCSLLAAAPAANAQSVVEVLQQQRRAARAAEVLDELGPRVRPRPAATLGERDGYVEAALALRRARQATADSMAAVERDSLARALQLREIVWVKTEPDGQGAFLERYREAYWRAADPRPGQPLDTTATTLLRGRLQAVFGRPTRNADALRQVGYAGSEFIQFEYWFIVNDSIPLLVLDLDGPFGTGLLVAGSEADAALLPVLKADLAARLAEALGPDPWVDYYHSFDRRQWYRTGYNGTEQFTLEIRPPRWSQRDRVDRWIIHR